MNKFKFFNKFNNTKLKKKKKLLIGLFDPLLYDGRAKRSALTLSSQFQVTIFTTNDSNKKIPIFNKNINVITSKLQLKIFQNMRIMY